MNVREKFLQLTSKTYPHPAETQVLEFLPDDLTRDKYGNYYKIIGESKSIFASHLDTADRTQGIVNHVFETDENGDEWVATDGSTILGADDKSGVCVLLYMMEHNIPGIYYFFIGEEVGLIGSGKVSQDFESFDHLQEVERIISFDRRGFKSIITNQMGRYCCSDDFANYLIGEYGNVGLEMEQDPGGVYTDSAIFMDVIPECTNISVGYFHEHSGKECQNLSFLEDLCEACIKVDWENAPTSRKVTIDDNLYTEKEDIIEYIKGLDTVNDLNIYEDNGRVCMALTVEDPSNATLLTEVEAIISGFDKYGVESYTEIEDDIIKIYLV
ncbi:MAG: putative peptidase [uncultured marine phage]|uniref:Putative peptidase n=1 Tax=uncultured marine phage TaxID=707152 RepID=A0A8D9CF39_9VIRU|nr:MAG: putative peptidase [uncultured marine phage]